MREALQTLMTQTKLLVGVSGSIAALGTPHALLWARESLGLTQVRVVLTPMALRLVARPSFQAAVDDPVIAAWDDLGGGAAPHVRLANWPDVILIMPATANILAKLAQGACDSLLTSILLATEKPIVLAPAMNPVMWLKPAVQRNVEQLRADGHEVIEPDKGLSLTSGAREGGSISDPRRPIITALTKVHGNFIDTVSGQAQKLRPNQTG